MEKPEVTVNINNLIGTLVIIGDKNNSSEIKNLVTETLTRVITSVSEIQAENSDISEPPSNPPQNSNSDDPE